jgi:low affinity Fe/Cu permease
MARKRSKASSAAGSAGRMATAGTSNGAGQSTGQRSDHSTWHEIFSRMASGAAHLAGHPLAFSTAVLLVGAWALTGPLFNYSDSWQLVINTSTTIVTFLMVFLIQSTQNRDTLAEQLKLAELIMAVKDAESRLATVEDLSEEELEALHDDYRRRAEEALHHLNRRRAQLGRTS